MNSDMNRVSSSVKTIQGIRERSSKFVNDREWNKFHLPASLSLALAGECGEICEIFQWKGDLDGKLHHLDQVFSEKELINIGEEIADVFIYSTRLCDICNLDLAYSIQLKNAQIDSMIDEEHLHYRQIPGQYRSSLAVEWKHLSLDDLDTSISSQAVSTSQGHNNNNVCFRSQRHVALSIQKEVGKVCSLFTRYSEADSLPGLPNWSRSDIASLSSYLAAICMLLAILARFTKHSLGQCISDKFLKNENKYPVELAKGSSAKYTEYVDTINTKNQMNQQQAMLTSNNNNSYNNRDNTLFLYSSKAILIVSAITCFTAGYLLRGNK